MTDVQRLAYAAVDFRRDHGNWPAHPELLAADPTLPVQDPWQHGFRFEPRADSILVRCAGLDGVLDTEDDVLSDRLRNPSTPP